MIANLLTTGWRFHQAGELAQAEQAYRELLQQEPDNAEGWYLLGSVYQTRGDLATAADHLDRALQLRPGYLEALNRRGIVHARQGQPAEAAAKFREFLGLRPGDVDVQTNLALALLRQGQFAEAIALLQAVIQQRPDYARAQKPFREAHALQAVVEGIAYEQQGKLEEADARLRQALEWQSDCIPALTHGARVTQALQRRAEAVPHNNRGVDLLDQQRLAEAQVCFQRAVQLDPGYAEAHANLGTTLWHLRRLEEAAVGLREAVRLRPDLAQAFHNLGTVLFYLGRYEEALANYDHALRIKPDYTDVYTNAGPIRVLLGDFERGWAEFDRALTLPHVYARTFDQPRWDGSGLAGRRILLHAECGLGDTIQFVRYARPLKEQGATVILECQRPLYRLLTRCPGIDELVARGDPLPPFDVHVSVLSLPHFLRTRMDTIPANVPYLSADPALVEQWRPELAAQPGFKIGINWEGSSAAQDPRRIPLAAFERLAKMPGVQLVSLQKGPGCAQLADVARCWPLTNLSDRLDETAGAFMDTAAVMMHLDLVVTSDTSVAHLAGALGVPVWMPLPRMAEWRWLLDRDDSPWYPSMRLFRQERPGEWGTVLQRVAQEVQAMQREKEAQGPCGPTPTFAMVKMTPRSTTYSCQCGRSTIGLMRSTGSELRVPNESGPGSDRELVS
jgi:tetratricopeptide (TPR) repeat protein